MKVDIKGSYSDEGGNSMKIKTTKKMRLYELIKHAKEQDWESVQAISDQGKEVYFTSDRNFIICGDYEGDKRISLDAIFTIEVEEELTEETEFEQLWEVYYNKGRGDVDAYTNGRVNAVTSTSVSQILQENSIDHENVTLAIYHRDTLLWSKDTGIPAEGVIDV